jgi:hypothetical protein
MNRFFSGYFFRHLTIVKTIFLNRTKQRLQGNISLLAV